MSDTESEKIRLENGVARPGLVKLGRMLMTVVQEALAPALAAVAPDAARPGERITTCNHVTDIRSARRTSEGTPVPNPGSQDMQVLFCPMHPTGGRRGESLICQRDVERHYEQEHHGEYERAACFVCEAPIRDALTGVLRGDFTPIFAEVTLHQAVPIRFRTLGEHDFVWRDDYSYVGDVATLPAAYLCPRHSGAIDLPIRMGWPMGHAS